MTIALSREGFLMRRQGELVLVFSTNAITIDEVLGEVLGAPVLDEE